MVQLYADILLLIMLDLQDDLSSLYSCVLSNHQTSKLTYLLCEARYVNLLRLEPLVEYINFRRAKYGVLGWSEYHVKSLVNENGFELIKFGSQGLLLLLVKSDLGPRKRKWKLQRFGGREREHFVLLKVERYGQQVHLPLNLRQYKRIR
ncbi:unnamed protein product [Rhizophagus irregularis]|nr:unnamed protein product [Rhizophagus irregularis]